MNTIGNILWIILGGGFFIALGYVLGGLVLCLTIVGIPFGLQLFKLAGLALFPFGKEVVMDERPSGCLAVILNIVWLIFGGIEVALVHVTFAILCAITIIGLPFAVQHLKLIRLSILPFGSRIV